MHTNESVTSDDEMDEKRAGRRRRTDTRRPYARLRRKMAVEASRFKSAQSEDPTDFRFTYEPARFEESWLLMSLGELYEHQWISDVLRRVRSGKEASVYQCRGGATVGGGLVAAKVYRPWTLRAMHSDGTYRDGRVDLDGEGRELIEDGMLHAIRKKSEYGRVLLYQSWMAYEYRTLQALHAAGADVPEPHMMGQHTILMGFVGDAQRAAPSLNEVQLEPGESRRLFDRVLHNIDVLLAQHRIHGDLSAYNILYWKGGITLIDFPQVLAPGQNRNAYRIFERDVRRVCEYFGRQGVDADAATLAAELWRAHGFAPANGPDGEVGFVTVEG
jgi:RIO kinase 1